MPPPHQSIYERPLRVLDFYTYMEGVGMLEHIKKTKSLRGFQQKVWGHFFYWFINSNYTTFFLGIK